MKTKQNPNRRRFFTVQICDKRIHNMALDSKPFVIEAGYPFTEMGQAAMAANARNQVYTGEEYGNEQFCSGIIIYETNITGRKLADVEPIIFGDVTILKPGEGG